MPAFEAELATTFSKVAAQGERIKNTFEKMNAGNLRFVREYVSTLKKAEQIRFQNIGREFRTDAGLARPDLVAKMNAAMDAQALLAWRRGAGAGGGAGAGAAAANLASFAPMGRGMLSGLGRGSIGGASGALRAAGPIGLAAAGGLMIATGVENRRVENLNRVHQIEQQILQIRLTAAKADSENALAAGRDLGRLPERLRSRRINIDQVKTLAIDQNQDPQDIAEGLITLADMPNAHRPSMMEVARFASRHGDMSYSDAMAGLAKSPLLQHQAQGSFSDMNLSSVAAQLLLQHKGLDATPARIEQNAMFLRRSSESDGSDLLANRAKQLRATEIERTLAGWGKFDSPAGSQALTEFAKEVQRFIDPLAAAMADWKRSMDKQNTMQAEVARGQIRLIAKIEDLLGKLYLGKGSLKTQHDRDVVNQGQGFDRGMSEPLDLNHTGR